MSTEDNKQLARRHTECWNQGNLALIEELLASDFIHHNPDRPDVRSREDYKRWFVEITCFLYAKAMNEPGELDEHS